MTRLVFLLALLTVVPEQKPATHRAPDLLIEGWLSTAGPYGESWWYTLTPGGSVSLHVDYILNPSGSLMAEFHVSDEDVARVRKAIETERFLELPEKISAEMVELHRPDYRLTITLGGRRAQVSLYDPAQIKSDPRTARFLKVWNEMYRCLPVKPSTAAAEQ